MSNAASNGIPLQGCFLRWKGASFDGLHSMTMSAKICLLLAAVYTFDDLAQELSIYVLQLPRKLQDFVTAVYLWESVETDAPQAKCAHTVSGQIRLNGERYRAAREYLRASANFHRTYPAIGKYLNKPNGHIKLELCVQTITNYGHGRLCSELVLEVAHHKFKGWLESNPHANGHISGFERALAEDWMSRCATLYWIWKNGIVREKRCARRGLQRLMLGNDGLLVEENDTSVIAPLRTFEDSLDAAFREPVLQEMELCGHINMAAIRSVTWEAQGRRNTMDVDDTMMKARDMILDWYTHHYGRYHISLDWYDRAVHMTSNKYGGTRRS